MGDRIDVDSESLPDDLKLLAQASQQAAVDREGDIVALLELLRLLEKLHREIRDQWFQEALPTNRQRLYALLRDIEVNGGWPYIQRMRLRSLLNEIEGAGPTSESSDSTADADSDT
ncbi:MAG: hypothetical protein AAF892_07255 [Cyanobacteria bacterium P01_D01_bin.71]